MKSINSGSAGMTTRKTECIDLSLYVGDDTIKPVSFVRDLGVTLASFSTKNSR